MSVRYTNIMCSLKRLTIVLSYIRAPTLTYTQQLESRIRALEAENAQLRRNNKSSNTSGPATGISIDTGTTTKSSETVSLPAHADEPSDASVDVLVGGFDGLKLDDRGVTTYHGATSFFHLLSSSRLPTSATLPSRDLDSDGLLAFGYGHLDLDSDLDSRGTGLAGQEKRQRLVRNAWHQRELETMSQIPVRR